MQSDHMRQRIEATALDLLVCHGVRGVSFGTIAGILGTTRANIHYHYGNKDTLVDEVIENYVARTVDDMCGVWTDPARHFADKIEAIAAFNLARYEKFNSEVQGRNWSLITRMRADADALSERSLQNVRRFTSELLEAVMVGTRQAIDAGVLHAQAPVRDIAVQFVNLVNSAGLTTLDAHRFDRLSEIYRAFIRMTLAAYGTGADARSASYFSDIPAFAP